MENQLTILSESLDKKLEVLQKIREYNKRQEEIFSAEKVDMSLFDDAVEEKQRLIDEVVRLDEGFEILYEKLAKELEGNRQRYAAQIRELQQKVSRVNSACPYRHRKPGTRNWSRTISPGNVPESARDVKMPKARLTTTRA